ncbi:hypothetical protein CEQ90_13085 [Lewinellaceae bacterium SD302]|nr:hypothetical protein CEQ90_13085 [Lewinellaceae bacterium SD302]
MSKDTLPYFEIGDYPEDFGPGSMLARYVDGLGYRYHWATEGLGENDLAYRPTPEASSSFETLEHVYGLSKTILNLARNTPNTRGPKEEMTFEDLRSATLLNFQLASEYFNGKTAEQMARTKLKFERDGKVNEMDLWLAINGQMSDALYHVGQLVSFRRTTGNPMHPGVSVFRGKTSF